MRVTLVRHTKPLIAPGICYGRLDIEADRSEDARIAADPACLGAACVWTSPARRCQGLAETIAGGIPLRRDARLQELDFGAWEGMAWDVVPRAELDRWAAAPLDFAPPSGESGAALIARVTGFYDDLCKDGRDCVVVSHGGPLKVLAALIEAVPVDLLAAPPSLGSIRMFSR